MNLLSSFEFQCQMAANSNTSQIITSMEEKVLEIFNSLQSTKTHEHVLFEKVSTLCSLIKQDTKEMIPIIVNVYLKVAQFARKASTAKRAAQTVEYFLRVFSLMVKCVNGILTTQQKELMTSSTLNLEEEFTSKIEFNEGIIKLSIDIALVKAHKSRMLGVNMLNFMVETINLEETSEEYSLDTLTSLLSYAILLIKEKSKVWISEGIKISSYFKFYEAEELTLLKLIFNSHLVTIINQNSEDTVRLQAISQIELTPLIVATLSSRIADKNRGIREKFLDRLKLNKISPIVFQKCSFLQMIHLVVNSKTEQAILPRFLNYISFFLQNPHNQSNSMTYKSFLEYLNPKILLHYPKVTKSIQNLIKQYLLMNQDRSIVFDHFISQICHDLTERETITDEIFYLYIAATSNIQRFNKTINRSFPSGVQLADIITKAFENNQFFQVVYLLKLVQLNINTDSVGKQKIFKVLLDLVGTSTYSTIRIPKNQLLYTNTICPCITQQQFQYLKFLKSSTHPITNTNDIIFLMLRQMFLINKTQFLHHIKQIATNTINQIHGYVNAVKSENEHLADAKRKKNQFMINEIEESISEFELKEIFYRNKLGIVAFAMYGWSQEAGSKLYQQIIQLTEDCNKRLIWIINCYYLKNRIKTGRKWVGMFNKMYEKFRLEKDDLEKMFKFESLQKPLIEGMFNNFERSINQNTRKHFFSYIVSLLLSEYREARSLGVKFAADFLKTTYKINDKKPEENLIATTPTAPFISMLFLIQLTSNLVFKDKYEIEVMFHNRMETVPKQVFMGHLYLITLLSHMVDHNLIFNPKIISLSSQTTISNLITEALSDFLNFQFQFFKNGKKVGSYLADTHDYLVLLLSIVKNQYQVKLVCKHMLLYPPPHREMGITFNSIIHQKLGDQGTDLFVKVDETPIRHEDMFQRSQYTLEFLRLRLANISESTLQLIQVFERYEVLLSEKKKEKGKVNPIKLVDVSESESQTGSRSVLSNQQQKSNTVNSKSYHSRRRLNVKNH